MIRDHYEKVNLLLRDSNRKTAYNDGHYDSKQEQISTKQNGV